MKKHEKTTKKFIKFLEKDENLKNLVVKSLQKAKAINPDKITNPAQSLEELYDFLDWSVKCLPWEVLKDKKYSSLYSAMDQATGYFWFIFDQPLDELKDKGFYYPSLQYCQPIASWIRDYAIAWGKFLTKKKSWNDDFYNNVLKDDKFGLSKGYYGNKNIWHSFNDFFSRKLIDQSYRPIADTDVVAPADSTPQGIYQIDENNMLINNDVYVKSKKLTSIGDLIGRDSAFCNAFAGGTLTHTFLDVNDYHRYHFPVDGKICEIRKIIGANAGGGVTEWNAKEKRYVYYNEMGFQMIETRDCIILETDKFGYVAILPVGMSQICSCNFEKDLKVGKKVRRGDPLGYFLFGGSNIIMIFQKDVNVEFMLQKNDDGSFKHLLMGEPYANLSKK